MKKQKSAEWPEILAKPEDLTPEAIACLKEQIERGEEFPVYIRPDGKILCIWAFDFRDSKEVAIGKFEAFLKKNREKFRLKP